VSVEESFDKSVNAAIEAGILDAEAHGAAIEAARKLAQMMDGSEWPMVNGKLDNVSPGVFLKYCAALGIVPGEAVAKQTKPASKEPAGRVTMTSMVGNSKWKQNRASNG